MQYADDDDSSFDGNRKSIHLNPLTHTRKSDDKIEKGYSKKNIYGSESTGAYGKMINKAKTKNLLHH